MQHCAQNVCFVSLGHKRSSTPRTDSVFFRIHSVFLASVQNTSMFVFDYRTHGCKGIHTLSSVPILSLWRFRVACSPPHVWQYLQTCSTLVQAPRCVRCVSGGDPTHSWRRNNYIIFIETITTVIGKHVIRCFPGKVSRIIANTCSFLTWNPFLMGQHMFLKKTFLQLLSPRVSVLLGEDGFQRANCVCNL